MQKRSFLHIWAIVGICGLLLTPHSVKHATEVLGDFPHSPWKAMGDLYVHTIPSVEKPAQRLKAARSVTERSLETMVASISTYQAVASQCDDSPGVTASGLDLSKPHGPIAAHMSLPFGTKLVIRGKTYTVQDRVNARFGPHHVDILTNGENHYWSHERVVIRRKRHTRAVRHGGAIA